MICFYFFPPSKHYTRPQNLQSAATFLWTLYICHTSFVDMYFKAYLSSIFILILTSCYRKMSLVLTNRGTKACLTATMSAPKAQYEMPKRYQQLGTRKKKENLSLSCCHLWKGLLKQPPNSTEYLVKAIEKITRLTWQLPLLSSTECRERARTCWVRVMDRWFGSQSFTAGALLRERIVTLYIKETYAVPL